MATVDLNPNNDVTGEMAIGGDGYSSDNILGQNVLKLILKSPRFVPFGGQSEPIWMSNLTSVVHRHIKVHVQPSACAFL